MKWSSPSVLLHLIFAMLGFDWRHLMIEAHKNRHHNVSGKGSGSGGTYHWNSSSSSISSSSQSEANQKEPLFDWDASTVSTSDSQRIQEVTTTLGQTAFLHCRVRYLADRRVLWMRQRDLHILTSALHTYTNDWRISALHTTVRETRGSPRSFGNSSSTRQPVYESRDNMATSPWTKKNVTDVWDDDDAGVWSEWTLRIRSTEAKDAGLYECQVSTEPKISKIYRLHVVVSKASILGSLELFVKKGSDINLTCVTVTDESSSDTPPTASPANKTPFHFTWHHNGQVLNYSARGGMSVTTDTIGGQSRLLLARADPRDSGNYSCVPGPGATPASVTVHVLNGEQPAAMQRDNAAGLLKPWWSWLSFSKAWATLIGLAVWSSWVTRCQLSDVT